jgi:hypothetical protein
MTLTQHQRDLASQLGSDAGTAAASWIDDVDTTPARAARCIALYDADDPAWHDDFGPQAWLSGEWADGDTPRSVAIECGIHADDYDVLDSDAYYDDRDELADLYESAADAAYETEVLRVAHTLVQP